MDIEKVKKDLQKGNEMTVIQIFNEFTVLLDTHEIKESDVDSYSYAIEYAKEKLNFPTSTLIILTVALLRGYHYTRYPWRAKKYAVYIIEELEGTKESFNKEQISDIYYDLGVFYRLVSNAKQALFCYEKSYEYVKNGNTFYNIVVCNKILDENHKFEFSTEEIKEHFPNDAQRIINAMEGKGYLKVDPIENSDEFQAVYDEVNEEALKILEKEGDLHLAIQKWGILFDLYLKRGIMWKSPHMMNPRVMFD